MPIQIRSPIRIVLIEKSGKCAAKKSIVSGMKGLLQPKPRKLVGTLPNELKGFFEPVNRLTKPASPTEIHLEHRCFEKILCPLAPALVNVLERPIDSTKYWVYAHLLDKNRVNGNEAHVLDELSRFGPERLFSQPHVPPRPPTNYGVRRRNPHTLRFYSIFS